MEIREHRTENARIAEIAAEEIVLKDADSELDLMATLYFDGFGCVILYKEQIAPEFFDLSTGIAGEVLQKFSNYRMQLVIVGDFENPASSSLRDFIRESNRTGHIRFVASLESALGGA
jgi:hypothetical protein